MFSSQYVLRVILSKGWKLHLKYANASFSKASTWHQLANMHLLPSSSRKWLKFLQLVLMLCLICTWESTCDRRCFVQRCVKQLFTLCKTLLVAGYWLKHSQRLRGRNVSSSDAKLRLKSHCVLFFQINQYQNGKVQKPHNPQPVWVSIVVMIHQF